MNTPITDANVKCIPILDPDGEGTLRMKMIVEPDVCREIEQQAARLAGALVIAQNIIGPHVIRSCGTCSECGGYTSSGTMKTCIKCGLEIIKKELAAWKEGRA